MVTYPSLTKRLHHDTYHSIDPRKRPELSVHGKTVVITGGGGTIGRSLAQAFADAGATLIHILDCRTEPLYESKQLVEEKTSSIDIATHIVDVVNRDSVQQTADEIECWDILVSVAGWLSEVEPLLQADAEDWWKCFEVNVKGNFNVIQSFLPNRNTGAVLIGMNAGSIQVPKMQEGFSAYNSSKFAALKTFEVVAVENPDLHVVSMHPGIVESDMSAKTCLPLPEYDSPNLAAHFAVWLCSVEAEFLRARFVWSNWDVDELMAKRKEFDGTLLATSNCIGWPYSP